MTYNDFTKPHPRTVLWFKERETCKQCRNCVVNPITEGSAGRNKGGGWHCIKTRNNKSGPNPHQACIAAREPGMPCGPDAKLFQPKEQSK